MDAKFTEKDFEQLSWHDNYIYGFHFSIRDIEAGDWSSDLVLDIDYIVEWLCGVDRSVQFKISPATLTFHNVTDLKINVKWEESEYRTSLHEISISSIERKKIKIRRYAWIDLIINGSLKPTFQSTAKSLLALRASPKSSAQSPSSLLVSRS